jgi:NAD(P)H-dependent FMN reductase
MFVPIILGTGREGRKSEKAALFLKKELEKISQETEIIDVKDFPLNFTGSMEKERRRELSAKLEKADAFIIVSPEYNHSYPGELKLLLDAFYQEYHRKPVGFCGVSSGSFGGSRMIEQLKLVALELKMVPIYQSLYFSNIKELFDEKGGMKDDSYPKRAKKFLEELLWFAATLKEARLNLKKVAR